jgi:hypothetical protein
MLQAPFFWQLHSFHQTFHSGDNEDRSDVEIEFGLCNNSLCGRCGAVANHPSILHCCATGERIEIPPHGKRSIPLYHLNQVP